jgi:rubrerythrin
MKGLAMDFKDLEDIVVFAIGKEKEAAEFYQDLSEQQQFLDKKKMLEEFAAEERKHQRLLEDLQSGQVSAKLDAYPFKWITDIKRSDYAVDVPYRPGMSYNELLMLAMKREERALALYNHMLANTQDPQSQKVFKMLCQEEAKHKLALETMYDDFMAQMGD